MTAVIPAYNHARFVGAAIESIIEQTYPNWELLVVDDASTDGTPEIVRRYAEKYPAKVIPVLHDRNRGQAFSANTALERARGELVTFLASDDVARPHRMQSAVNVLAQNPKLAAVFSRVECIDAEGEPLPGSQIEAVFNRPIDHMRLDLLCDNFLCATSCVARIDAIKNAGGFNPSLRRVEDYDLWLRLLDHHDIARVDDVWVSYRLHGSNLSLSPGDGGVHYESVACILRAIKRWPLELLFSFEHPPGSAGRRAAEASALCALAEHCMSLDNRFGRPALGTGYAYILLLDAIQKDGGFSRAQELLPKVRQLLDGSAAA